MLFNDRTGVAFGVLLMALVIRVQQMHVLSLKATVELGIMGTKDLYLILCCQCKERQHAQM